MTDSPLLLIVGNPWLNIVAEVSHDLLNKYGLKPGDRIFADTKHAPLYQELIKDYPVEYLPGGTGKNTSRCFQWRFQKPNTSHYIGSIGGDQFGTLLEGLTRKDGVEPHYMIDKTASTGTCAILITEKEKTVVANLGASNKYNKEHFESPEIQELVQRAQFFYICGFFATASLETIIAIGEHALATNSTFLLRISAPVPLKIDWDQLDSVFPYADVIFGNEADALAFGQKQGWPEDIGTIGQLMASLPKKNTKKQRIVIITQGEKDTLVFSVNEHGDVEFTTIYPPQLEPHQILDLNGAGDVFVGGFLSEFVKGADIERAVNAGHWCARHIIQTSDWKFSSHPTWEFE